VLGGRRRTGEPRGRGPGQPAGDGNSLYVGIEIDYNPGLQAASSAQIRSAQIAAAAIVSRLGHGRKYVRAHKGTSTTGKIDPSRFRSMDAVRDRVGEIIRANDWLPG
jgi:hypothetical protein